MEERTLKRWCLLVALRPDSDTGRLVRDVPMILEMIKGFSNGEYEQCCRSNDRLLFGYFLKSKKPADMMRAEFESCRGTIDGDHMMIFEVGEGLAGTSGFARAWTWLQRH
jgi:hypothetical protein